MLAGAGAATDALCAPRPHKAHTDTTHNTTHTDTDTPCRTGCYIQALEDVGVAPSCTPGAARALARLASDVWQKADGSGGVPQAVRDAVEGALDLLFFRNATVEAAAAEMKASGCLELSEEEVAARAQVRGTCDKWCKLSRLFLCWRPNSPSCVLASSVFEGCLGGCSADGPSRPFWGGHCFDVGPRL